MKIRRQHAGWYLLFPTGLQEKVREVSYDETDSGDEYSMTARNVLVEWDAEVLQQLVTQTQELFAQSRRHGAGGQPLPVSLMHSIEERIWSGWYSGDNEGLARVGNLFATHYSDGVDGRPAGVYGLIEWSDKGRRAIDSREWVTLSPTTVEWLELRDGTRIDGDLIVAVALVDVPALDCIGTVYDGLPADAFPVSGWEFEEDAGTPVERMSDIVSRAISRGFTPSTFKHAEGVVARSATSMRHCMKPKTTAPQKRQNEAATAAPASAPAASTEAVPESAPATEARNLDETQIGQMIADALKPIIETMQGLGSRLETVEKACGPKPEENAEAEPDGDPEEDVTEEEIEAEARALVVSARKSTLASAKAEAADLIEARRLNPGDAAEYLRRRVNGGDVDELVSGAPVSTRMTGVPKAGTAAPKASGASVRMTEEEIYASVDAELRAAGKHSPKAVLALGLERINNAIKSGTLIEAAE